MTLPAGWARKRLDQLGKLWSGSTPSTSNPEYWDGDIVWVTPTDLSRLRTPYLNNSTKRLTERGLRACSAQLLPPGSIVLSSRAPIGYVAIPNVTFCTNQGCKSLELYENSHSEYTYYSISFHADRLKMLGEGTTFAEISKRALSSVELTVPQDKEEQTKIAQILLAIDRAIHQTEALIAKQQRIKHGLMQDLFTRGLDEHGNLRSEETHEFGDSEAGRIPAGWKVETLNDCVRPEAPICYGILMPGKSHDNGVPVIKVKDIQRGRILQDDLLLTDPRIDREYRRSRLQAGDLLITIRGTTGRIAAVPAELDQSNITQDTARIRLNQRASARYFRHLLQSKFVQDQISLHTIGQAVKGINIRDVKRLVVVTPHS